MTIIDGLDTTGGVHCETSTLGVLFEHAGLELSEPMRFGLASGLSFIIWDSKQQAVPFLGGRVKPFELTRHLCGRLCIGLDVHETTSARKAWEHVRDAIDGGTPVGLQLDSYHLEYFTSRVHFAGHVVAMYGYDDEQAWLVDTAQQGGHVRTSLESLTRARAEKGPMAAKHRSFTVRVPEGGVDPVAAIVPAIVAGAEAFLSPPIANFGGRGIRTAAQRIPTWLDRVADPRRDLPLIAMLMERAGTGGALFRNLYRDFLGESVEALGSAGRDADAQVVARGRDAFAESAARWTRVAGLIETAGESGERQRLVEAGRVLEEIAEIEIAAMAGLVEGLSG